MKFQLVIGLGLVAFALLAYSWYDERQDNIALKAELDAQSITVMELRSQHLEQETAFFVKMTSEATMQQLQAIANAGTVQEREGLAAALFEAFHEDRVRFIVAEEVIGRVAFMVSAASVEERQEILTRLTAKVEAMWAETGTPPSGIISGDAVKELSTIVTALGGIASALAAAFVALTGGWKRPFEKELMAIDVEKQRLELIVSQHQAREALDYAASLEDKKSS